MVANSEAAPPGPVNLLRQPGHDGVAERDLLFGPLRAPGPDEFVGKQQASLTQQLARSCEHRWNVLEVMQAVLENDGVESLLAQVERIHVGNAKGVLVRNPCFLRSALRRLDQRWLRSIRSMYAGGEG
ncbi:MAG TPA: hypothetical protein VGO85_11005, partial [Caldimonas sp.]|nr:hypothetical protein [Caldimonas sp.]